ncbi:MAG: energy transducer TonB [Gammaproteobacteria bacterium]|nr:energy transducer TonB [Gammaproteobacteria bacterium]
MHATIMTYHPVKIAKQENDLKDNTTHIKLKFQQHQQQSQEIKKQPVKTVALAKPVKKISNQVETKNLNKQAISNPWVQTNKEVQTANNQLLITNSKPFETNGIVIPKQTKDNIQTSNLHESKKKSDSHNENEILNQYRDKIMAIIEQNKYYPKIARRRHIEGNVKVQFKLLNDGKISQLESSEAQTILLVASKNAVNESLPLPLPPKSLNFPMEISFYMQFQLR